MVELETQDRKQLIALLQYIPELATEAGRKQVLELAGLKKLLPRIDIAGAPFVANNQIISYLSTYGRFNYDHEALGMFLNAIKDLVGEEQQILLDQLLQKYAMMIPAVSAPTLNDWRGSETNAGFFEKIIGENTLRPIAFLAQGLQVARAVAYIGVHTSQKSWSGTGFLIAPSLLLTNNHVLPQRDMLASTIFRFNYEENFKGEAQPIQEYRARVEGIFRSTAKPRH
jgi:hypothetical protein